LVLAGLNNCQIARATGIPRSTVRDWRTAERWDVATARARGPLCPNLNEFGASYAYLLGLYLGDGCLSAHPRGVYRLRVALDARYPGIIQECVAAMEAVLPSNRAGVQRIKHANAVEVGIFSTHLPRLSLSTARAENTSARSVSRGGNKQSSSAVHGNSFAGSSIRMAPGL
jgi:hypothetical protein